MGILHLFIAHDIRHHKCSFNPQDCFSMFLYSFSKCILFFCSCNFFLFTSVTNCSCKFLLISVTSVTGSGKLVCFFNVTILLCQDFVVTMIEIQTNNSDSVKWKATAEFLWQVVHIQQPLNDQGFISNPTLGKGANKNCTHISERGKSGKYNFIIIGITGA